MHTLQTLQIFGLDPASESARRAIALVAEHGRWEHAGQRYFDGEVEPCINGRTIETGAYFGVDVAPIVERILGERLADGGWNCEAENGSVRSSFDTTINVLDGLLEFERATGGSAAVREARRGGEEYLLERGLFRRKSTGEVVDPAYLEFAFPYYWHYDVLRALDYFRGAGADPDPRMAEAVERRAVQAAARRPVAARPHPSGSRPLRARRHASSRAPRRGLDVHRRRRDPRREHRGERGVARERLRQHQARRDQFKTGGLITGIVGILDAALEAHRRPERLHLQVAPRVLGRPRLDRRRARRRLLARPEKAAPSRRSVPAGGRVHYARRG